MLSYITKKFGNKTIEDNMGKQNRTQQKENSITIIIILGIMTVVAIIGMFIALSISNNRTSKQSFTPPPFEVSAIEGTPKVSEELEYNILYQEGMSFQVGLCGNVRVTKDSADIYLTNTEENEVWIKVRVYDENGTILGESGLLKAGEYVKSVALTESISTDTQIKLKIMSYEPETYYSCGSIVVTPNVVRVEE